MLKMHVFLCWLSSRVGKPLAKLEYLTKCMHPSVCLHHSFEANKNMFYNKSPIVYQMILLFYFLKAAQIDWQHSLPYCMSFKEFFLGFLKARCGTTHEWNDRDVKLRSEIFICVFWETWLTRVRLICQFHWQPFIICKTMTTKLRFLRLEFFL